MSVDDRPSLRDERKSSTRERILEATADLVREEGSVDVPLTAVAARAGIGERTLYRYFATKSDLFTALFRWITQGATDEPIAPGSAGLLDVAADFFAAYERNPEIIRALSAEKPAELRASRAEQRRAAVVDALDDEVAGVPEPRRTQVLAAVHLLTSSDAFLHANDFWGLDAGEVVAMSCWAVRALLASTDLEEDDG